ncbi:S24 family peptidase [Paraburkholderia caballeronis]|nr:S24 family peptidase [Paraburkholderia caballeronis]
MSKSDERREERRLALLRLKDQFGRGGIAKIARTINKEPNYVSRMLYPPDKPGAKGIGEDSVVLLDEHFPGWQSSAGSPANDAEPGIVLSHSPKSIGSNEIEVPRFEAPASMGLGRPTPDQENVVELLRVSSSWLRSALPHISSPANLAVLPASGDSMEPTFSDSDLLWVDRGVREIRTEAVYVLALRDELYVKRLQRRPDGAILMISDNKSYDPYVIENGEREQFQVLGRVVFAWRGKRL